MADSQTNPQFEQFSKRFWGSSPEGIDYVLLFSKHKLATTIDESLYLWLFKDITQETYLVISPEKVTIFCPKRFASQLSDLSKMSDTEIVPIDDEDSLIDEVKKMIGTAKVAVTDTLDGENSIDGIDAENAQSRIEDAIIVHSSGEQTRSRNAAKIADKAIRKVIEKNLASIIEDHEPTECIQLSRQVQKEINNPEALSLHFTPADVEFPFLPAISCGKNIKVQFPPKSEGNIPANIINMAIATAVGIRFKTYVGAVGRTFLFNATDEQKAAYNDLIRARDKCIESIKTDVQFSEIYKTFKNALDSKYHNYIPKCIGKYTGTQVCTKYHTITEDSDEVAKAGTTLILIFGFEKFPINSEDSYMDNTFSVQIIDTFQVGDTEENCKLVTTTSCEYKLIAYTLDNTESKRMQEYLNDNRNMAERTRRHTQDKNKEVEDPNQQILQEFKRERKQRSKVEETSNVTEKIQYSYSREDQVPRVKEDMLNKIVLSKNANTVFFPVYGALVPFHISYIKKSQEEKIFGKNSYLNIGFEIPKKDIKRDHIYIREFMFTTKGNQKFNDMAKGIRDMRSHYHNELKKINDEKNLFKSNEGLQKIEGSFPSIRGSNLHIRPALAGKKSVGNLEAHKNGFRYRSTQGEHVIIYYSNIKLAIFQPSEKETITLIHFLLKSPIKIANKPTNNITFYKQVVESSVETSVRVASTTDQGEIMEEERESRFRKKINKEFKSFCKAVMNLEKEHQYPNIPKFEIPQKQLGFYGVPERSLVLLKPTISALVYVLESPVYVLMTNEIQLAIVEHKDLKSRTFDLTFILLGWEDKKEMSQSISQVNTIDVEYFDRITGWLSAIDIPFFVRKTNLNWKKLLPAMRSHAEDLQTDEGWKDFLQESESESEDETENTDDQAFTDDDEFDEYDDDEEFDENIPDTDEDDEPPEVSTSDEGEDWDRMEEKAKAYDSRHANRFKDDDDERSTKKSSSKGHRHHHHSKH